MAKKTYVERMEKLKKKLNKAIDASLENAEDFDSGKKVAATRLRKDLMELKKLCNEKCNSLREKVLKKVKKM